MKIGLLSPYYSQNYGTVLQAFALAKAIRNLGSDCEYLLQLLIEYYSL